ncbi:MAG: two-component sensor histidine kinase [uncultured bacterium]|nr:MAG: two-component sensor histidine kinase [uncultured bacterium]HBH17410.1 hypothetical protein [Cyanobacteria bacterium UBA9579]
MRKLRIYEQLLIVFLTAVLLPLCIAALIVINVNQHAVREEIKYSANLTADSVYHRLLSSIEARKLAISHIAESLNYIKSPHQINDLLKKISNSSNEIPNIDIINQNKNNEATAPVPNFTSSNTDIIPDYKNNALTVYAKLPNNSYIREFIDLKRLESEIFKYIVNDKRQVYIIDSNKDIVMSYNRDDSTFEKILPDLPQDYKIGEPIIFGQYKNQPHIFLKLTDPDWAIVVITPKNLTNYGIAKARFKIIHALIIAALSIIVIGIWYSLSLNTSIKQLLKAIYAMEKGNYRKRVRLIKDFFAPYEFVLLINEFNNMVRKVDESHQKLQQANEQLSKLDEMKSNLIDTVSHEFRTPLTCIKGYTSRLLRNDIQIDEDTRIKSLKVIKQQTERLSRLVEDLLVIPDIESSLIRLFPTDIDLRETFESCILSIQQKQARIINLSIDENAHTAYADQDRVEQVIINLLDNAIKYSPENSEININVSQENDKVLIKIQNEYEPIPETILNTLFDKFTRIDDNLTRTTRGTGLGLFIAKGLIENMGGTITLCSQNEFEVSITLPINSLLIDN